MFGSKPKKAEDRRYYLLPGQGRGAPGQGRGARKKHRQQIYIALLVGCFSAAALGVAIWVLNQN
jgi:hypothetical protein